MGIHDRDGYREATTKQNEPWHFGPAPRPWGRQSSPLWKFVAVASALALAYWMGREGALTLNVKTPNPRSEADLRSVTPPTQLQTRPAESSPQIRGEAQSIESAGAARSAVPDAPVSRTVYLCKSYNGGMFWSSSVCSSQRAFIDRLFTVPGRLSWDDQILDANRQWSEIKRLYDVPQGAALAAGITPIAKDSSACAALEGDIRRIDAAARQPQSAWTQDQLRQERQVVRSRQAELHC